MSPTDSPPRRRLAVAAAVLATVVALVAPALPAGAQESRIRADCTSYEPAPELGRYVTLTYTRNLLRCPSPSDYAYWVGRLQGGMSRAAFVEWVARSAEGLDVVVEGIYDQALEESASEAEGEAARALLRSRRDAAPLVGLVFGSDEFMRVNEYPLDVEERDEAWVDDMYAIWLERPADAPGRAHFLATFGPGGSTPASRARVIVALLHSREGTRKAVQLAYEHVLQREADAPGAAYWEAWLRGPGRHRVLLFRSMMLGSAEGFALVRDQ